MFGENYGLFKVLRSTHQRLQPWATSGCDSHVDCYRRASTPPMQKGPIAFYNFLDDEDLVQAARGLFWAWYGSKVAPGTTVGFKEIRYGRQWNLPCERGTCVGNGSNNPCGHRKPLDWHSYGGVLCAEFERDMWLLRQLCADTRIILHIRDVASTSRTRTVYSANRMTPKEAQEEIQAQVDCFVKYKERNEASVLLSTFEALVRAPRAGVPMLLDYLGVNRTREGAVMMLDGSVVKLLAHRMQGR
eukprot:jgi/Mesvir1/22657/Mv14091-RA.1